jgi:hypothetical protein
MAKFSGYPSSRRAGNIIEPTAIKVTGEEPEIAAKTIQAATAATAKPPGRPAKRARISSTKRRAMPPAVMIAPEAIKSGIAKNSCLVARFSMCCTSTWRSEKLFISVKLVRHKAVATPTITKSGAPMTIRKRRTPMTINVMTDPPRWSPDRAPTGAPSPATARWPGPGNAGR